MQWLNTIVEELEKSHPDTEVLVSSGVSPSGTYHLGTLREVLTAEAIFREFKRRGKASQHIHVVDDLDIFRKVPEEVPNSFETHLGKPLCDVPAPDESGRSYADFFLADLLEAAKPLKLEMDVMRAHQKYREGFFGEAIEKALDKTNEIKGILEEVSGHRVDEQWSPVQVIEEGYLKNRQFVEVDKNNKTITYIDKDKQHQTLSYAKGDVKLNWRIDWPARWWLLGVKAEPFGRDHATKGGSYDTGKEIAKQVYGIDAPLPLPYNFINRTGQTKKMSKSAGDTISAAQLLKMLPAEVVWFFMLRYSPDKPLFFDEGPTLMRLVDEFSELLAKDNKSADEKQLLELCLQGIDEPTVSSVPFSHLVASYQAALRDVDKTLDIIRRTEHKVHVDEQEQIIKNELRFIDEWLKRSAPEDIKFELAKQVDGTTLSDAQKQFLNELAGVVENAPAAADGEWFHKAIYNFKDSTGMEPKELFTTLYRVIIGKDAGPRAGWFLSILPREWLVKRLQLKE